MIGCQEISCEIKHFLKVTEGFIYDSERFSYDQQRNLFRQHCFNYPKIFDLMLRLKSGKEKVKAFDDFFNEIKTYSLEKLQEEKRHKRNN